MKLLKLLWDLFTLIWDSFHVDQGYVAFWDGGESGY
jgi:hypothetical protein